MKRRIWFNPGLAFALCWFALLLGVGLVSFSFAVNADRWAVNPKGTDAVAYGRVEIDNPGGPCLNMQIHGNPPLGRVSGTIWIQDDGLVHKFCYTGPGLEDHCINATEVP